MSQSDAQKQLIDASHPVKVHNYDSENRNHHNANSSNDSNRLDLKTNIFSSFEQENANSKSKQHEDSNITEGSENTRDHSFHPPQYMNKPESINNGK